MAMPDENALLKSVRDYFRSCLETDLPILGLKNIQDWRVGQHYVAEEVGLTPAILLAVSGSRATEVPWFRQVDIQMYLFLEGYDEELLENHGSQYVTELLSCALADPHLGGSVLLCEPSLDTGVEADGQRLFAKIELRCTVDCGGLRMQRPVEPEPEGDPDGGENPEQDPDTDPEVNGE